MLRLNSMRREIDILINTNGGVKPIPFVDITYIHSPLLFNMWYSWPSIYKAYLFPRNAILKSFARHGMLGLILTNSRFTKIEIKKVMGLDSIVLYPPIDVERYMKYSNNEKRERLVISIGRFSPKKRYEDLIEIASRVKDAKFVIIGAVSDVNYMRRITRLIKEKGLSNVIVKPNASFQEKLELLSRAKVYLHTARNERFGISIVEGMAAGCVPVVYRSRGPWLDILEERQGVYGFAYRDLDEAASMIGNVLDNDVLWREILINTRSHVLKFSRNAFKRKLMMIMKETLATRNHYD